MSPLGARRRKKSVTIFLRLPLVNKNPIYYTRQLYFFPTFYLKSIPSVFLAYFNIKGREKKSQSGKQNRYICAVKKESHLHIITYPPPLSFISLVTNFFRRPFGKKQQRYEFDSWSEYALLLEPSRDQHKKIPKKVIFLHQTKILDKTFDFEFFICYPCKQFLKLMLI